MVRLFGLVFIIIAGCDNITTHENVNYTITRLLRVDCTPAGCSGLELEVVLNNSGNSPICVPEFYVDESLGRYMRLTPSGSTRYFYLLHRGIPNVGVQDPNPQVREDALRQLPAVRIPPASQIRRTFRIQGDNSIPSGPVAFEFDVEYFACGRSGASLDFIPVAGQLP